MASTLGLGKRSDMQSHDLLLMRPEIIIDIKQLTANWANARC